MTKHFLLAGLLACLSVATGAALAATATYDYDALGRLTRVTYSDGKVVFYRLDAAGNRTQVLSGTLAGAPSSITVPSSSTSGSYTISWGTATGTVTAYNLYEANNSSFSGQTLVYSGTALSAALSGRGNGTYYYRAKACFDSECGAYRAGSNGVTVTIATAPGVPSSITVPSSSTSGSYTISWGAATGTLTAYELYEATSSGFSGQTLIYNGTALNAALSGRGNGTYYYRVRACLNSLCSAYQAGANAVTVTIPPPPSIQVLNPSIQVGATGQATQITTLANLNGIPATINSFAETCTTASAVIQSGAQSVQWTNANTFWRGCEPGVNEQCTASYVIRNSSTGQLHSGTSAITVLAQGRNLPGGQVCP